MKLEKFYDRGINWLNVHGPDAVAAILLFFIGMWAIRLLRARLKSRLIRRHTHSSLQPFVLSLTITAMYVVLILTVLAIVDVHITILLPLSAHLVWRQAWHYRVPFKILPAAY